LELTPTTVTIFSLAVAAIVWLIRLEGRVNRNQERWQDEKDSREKLSSHVDRHVENTDIHFNKQFFFEFKDKIESKLEQLDESMKTGFESVTEQIKELWDSK
jgi:hypothetical protein